MRNVSLDEQRHIAFGVRLLADLYAEIREPVQEAIVEKIRETLPWTRSACRPPAGHDLHRAARLHAGGPLRGGRALQESRLRSIGLPLDQIRASRSRST